MRNPQEKRASHRTGRKLRPVPNDTATHVPPLPWRLRDFARDIFHPITLRIFLPDLRDSAFRFNPEKSPLLCAPSRPLRLCGQLLHPRNHESHENPRNNHRSHKPHRSHSCGPLHSRFRKYRELFNSPVRVIAPISTNLAKSRVAVAGEHCVIRM